MLQVLICLTMSFLESITAVCIVLNIVAVLLLVLVLMAVAVCRKSRSRESNLLKKIQARDESLIAYGESLGTIYRHMYNTDRSIATLKNYLKEDKAMLCYATYMSRVIALLSSWKALSIYAGLLSRVRYLSEHDKDDTMIRMMNTHLAETEKLCSRINGEHDMYPLQRRRLVNI